jgi:hypothetical protein
MGEQYRSAFTIPKFMSADVACTAGVFTKLGAYTIQAGELVSLGYGANESQEGSPGRVYFDIRDNGTSPGVVKDGVIRISVWSPQDRPLKVLAEFRTETLRTDKVNRTLQVPFPSSGFPFVTKDKKIVIEYKADTTATISATNSFIIMDVTLGVA